MILERKAKGTLTPFELNHGDKLRFELSDGEVCEIELVSTSAQVLERNYPSYGYLDHGDISVYAFECELRVNGKEVRIERFVGSQESFYEPFEQDGIRLWFDAVTDIFIENGGFMDEKDWRTGLLCKPNRKARFAIQDASLSVCPEPIGMWCELPDGRVNMKDCYNGEDCWMGPYAGAHAHCGLDINHPAGTQLYAPISFDDHYYFHSVAAGFNNNRWRGIRRWSDGSEWWLQSHHLVELLVPERQALERGTAYATTAGVWIGAHEHTHFLFRVLDQGGDYFLDPWILFREMLAQATTKL
ncbi:MAG: hypothetical protein O3B01_00395 [Planctomycetota bacterium]|nr:hypothetical protein [Planctomycetota bacterium]MDA1137012.1 hypothetical protein [Planctomycetota bacterium]